MSPPPSRIVPSDELSDGLSALRWSMDGAHSVSAAVAFVTASGVELLAQLLAEMEVEEMELVARAADVTDPDALLTLKEPHGVQVSVLIGRAATSFHPKLWLCRTNDQLRVVAGSGNLTAGGLVGNQEQFEVLSLPSDSAEAQAQEERFALLVAGAVSLEEVEGSAIWHEWLAVRKHQQPLRSRLRQMEKNLNEREVKLSRAADKEVLLADLYDIYHRTLDAKLPRQDGGTYVPGRFRIGIDRAADGGDPVELVTRLCRVQTGGFDVILTADRPDLTVEALVVDEGKPYHDLFMDKTCQLSAERLKQFRSWVE